MQVKNGWMFGFMVTKDLAASNPEASEPLQDSLEEQLQSFRAK